MLDIAHENRFYAASRRRTAVGFVLHGDGSGDLFLPWWVGFILNGDSF